MQSVVKCSSGAMEEGSRRFKNASAHVSSLVVVQVACIEVGRPAAGNKDPTALHAKACNQSRNVPAGRWKKAPERSRASVHVVSIVSIQSAVDEVGRSGNE